MRVAVTSVVSQLGGDEKRAGRKKESWDSSFVDSWNVREERRIMLFWSITLFARLPPPVLEMGNLGSSRDVSHSGSPNGGRVMAPVPGFLPLFRISFLDSPLTENIFLKSTYHLIKGKVAPFNLNIKLNLNIQHNGKKKNKKTKKSEFFWNETQ